MGNAAPPSWQFFGRQSLLLNIGSREQIVDNLILDLAGLFVVLPLLSPLVHRRLSPHLEARPTWNFLTGTETGQAISLLSSLVIVSIQPETMNVRHTFTGTLQMTTDFCLVLRLTPRINPPPCPSVFFDVTLHLSFVRSPFGYGLPACGEVKLIRGRIQTKLVLWLAARGDGLLSACCFRGSGEKVWPATIALGNDTTGYGSSLCFTLRIDFIGVSQS
ncbi:hypothetical protein BKA63DRAFT_263339 [Paraphoma chrysanthemicola]|nr:hypothetical protein BKA63DRAFT_263339 [Paraphoma chrysanthemicola]